jgi:hypothetical protein
MPKRIPDRRCHKQPERTNRHRICGTSFHASGPRKTIRKSKKPRLHETNTIQVGAGSHPGMCATV